MNGGQNIPLDMEKKDLKLKWGKRWKERKEMKLQDEKKVNRRENLAGIIQKILSPI